MQRTSLLAQWVADLCPPLSRRGISVRSSEREPPGRPASELTFRRPPSILFPFPTEGVSSMKVILQETLEGVGNLGDLIDVSDGFARNFLLPRRKALEASNRNI